MRAKAGQSHLSREVSIFHNESLRGLVGGGHWPRPGEVTLSHQGDHFLDELPEFGQGTLESLRQPIEDKTITIRRAQGTATLPANFTLVAAMNPCPPTQTAGLISKQTVGTSATDSI